MGQWGHMRAENRGPQPLYLGQAIAPLSARRGDVGDCAARRAQVAPPAGYVEFERIGDSAVQRTWPSALLVSQQCASACACLMVLNRCRRRHLATRHKAQDKPMLWVGLGVGVGVCVGGCGCVCVCVRVQYIHATLLPPLTN